jgi:hypothetical protein
MTQYKELGQRGDVEAEQVQLTEPPTVTVVLPTRPRAAAPDCRSLNREPERLPG